MVGGLNLAPLDLSGKDNFHLIPELPLAAKKPWISERTLRLISTFQATTFTDCAPLKAARKAIKKSARNDKKLS